MRHQQNRQFIRGTIGFVLNLILVPALLFISAGTLKWPMAWAYAGFLLATNFTGYYIVLKKYPDLLAERARYVSMKDVLPGDKLLSACVGLFGPVAMMIIAGLDRRFGWSSLTPVWGQIAAAAVLATGYGFAVWAITANRFFSAVARIQKDRGQVVVTKGPYRYVRHPAYAGAFLGAFSFPVMLDSIWAFIPGLLLAAVLFIRTRREDRMLMEGLEGYPSYAEKIPYRIIPGIW
jgi:protein-S-isoprenylcysteine O-methyltransferase Ste14